MQIWSDPRTQPPKMAKIWKEIKLIILKFGVIWSSWQCQTVRPPLHGKNKMFLNEYLGIFYAILDHIFLFF